MSDIDPSLFDPAVTRTQKEALPSVAPNQVGAGLGDQVGLAENIGLGFETTAVNTVVEATSDNFENSRSDLDAIPTGEISAFEYAYEQASNTLFGNFDQEYVDSKADHVDALIDGLPRKYHADILDYNSLSDAEAARGRALAELESERLTAKQHGYDVARLGGSMLDFDLPLVAVSGGGFGAVKTAAKFAKASGSVRVGAAAAGVSAGFQAGVVTSATELAYGDGVEAADLGYRILMSSAMGGGAGFVFPSMIKTADDVVERVRTADPSVSASPDVSKMAPVAQRRQPTIIEESSSVGAEDLGTAAKPSPFQLSSDLKDASERTKEITKESDASNFEDGFYERRAEDANRLLTQVANSSWGTAIRGNSFMARAYESASPTLNWLGRSVFDSSNGLLRGRATAATLKDMYHARIASKAIPVKGHIDNWAKRNGETLLGTGYGSSDAGRAAAYREIMLIRNERAMGRAVTNTDPDLNAAADALSEAYKESHRILRGRDDEFSVDGFDAIPENEHYAPLVWSGEKIESLLASGQVKLERLHEAMAASYRAAGMWEGKDALAVAKAVVQRMRLREGEVDTSVLGLLQNDGREFLETSLRNSGLRDAEIDGILKRLVGDAEERGKEGFAKKRNDIDLAGTIPTEDGTDLKIVDLLSHNIENDFQRYTRGASGSAALARQGITSKGKRDDWLRAIHDEQRSAGEELLPPEEFAAMMSNFDAGPRLGYSKLWSAGEAAPAGAGVALVKRMTNLAWLGKMGLTQLGETGAMIASQGLGNWVQRGPGALMRRELREANEATLNDLAYLMGDIGQEQRLMGNHLSIDEVGVGDKADMMTKLNSKLDQASYIHSYASLFNNVRSWQQKTAALGIADKVFRTLKAELDGLDDGVNALTEAQKTRMWNDLGLDQESLDYLSGQIENGNVTFRTENGRTFVDRLNMENWETTGGHDMIFASAVYRGQSQQVQKGLAGESDAWMQTGVGSLLSHLKSFPLMAVDKQLVRNMRTMDPEAFSAVGYSLATAMFASLLREQTSNGKDMSVEDHARRAFGYSNMTGFIPMAYDPLMTILGLENARINQFGPHSEVSVPALSFANNAMRLPGAVSAAAGGDADYHDLQALRTIPFSSIVGFGEAIKAFSTRNQ